jgi:hypothetical protein
MSKFPALEEIDESLAAADNAPEFQNDDFLAREKAVLGDDAEAFGGEGAVDEVSGFEASFPALETTNVSRVWLWVSFANGRSRRHWVLVG